MSKAIRKIKPPRPSCPPSAQWLRRSGCGTLVAFGLLFAGCGHGAQEPSDRPASSVAALPLAPVSRAVKAACRHLAASRSVRVLCPTVLPSADADRSDVQVLHRDLGNSSCEYLIEMDRFHAPQRASLPFHMFIGGRCGTLPLATRHGQWPAHLPLPRDLRLIGSGMPAPGKTSAPPIRLIAVMRTKVGNAAALLVRSRHFPAGGIHGGHYSLIWNERGNGYVVSLHFPSGDHGRPPTRREERLLRAVAADLHLVE
jgi:hypothetical protein